MSKTGKVNKLNQHTKQAFLEIHPLDAAQPWASKKGM
jgi:ferredoxin-nitrate reductase